MSQDNTRDVWSGTILGTEGWRARLEMELTRDGARVAGTGTYRLVADERMEDSRIRVEGTWSGDDVRLDLSFEGKDAKGTITARHQALTHHAKAAIYGTYEEHLGTARKDGVVIVWLYAKRQ